MYRRFTPLFLFLFVAACASLQAPAARVNVPDKLKPGANESLAMIVPAKGVLRVSESGFSLQTIFAERRHPLLRRIAPLNP
jgi:hypothetical protein